MFCDKLSELMDLYQISNVQMAKETFLDPSYISRLRSGKRTLPEKPEFLDCMVDYFLRLADSCKNEDQVFLLMGINVPANIELKKKALYQWLNEENIQKEGFDRFLEKLGRTFSMPSNFMPNMDYKSSESDLHFFYGDEGKRDAVLAFLDRVVSLDKPAHFKLFSDESIFWMTGDKDFTQKWFYLLMRALKMGCKMTIIHNVSRNLDEMMKAIEQWLPLYMVADIEPYYYPKVKDGVYKRTIFIAKNVSAISSLSVGNNTSGILNFLIDDKKAVKALETEFDRYLSLCKPLFEIRKIDLANSYFKLYKEKIRGDGNFYYMGSYPTFYTMPESLAKRLDTENPDIGLLDMYNFVHNDFMAQKGNKTLSEIVNLSPDRDKYGVYFGNALIEYSKEDYFDHLVEIKRLSDIYPNYKFYSDDGINPNISIFMREDCGVIIERREEPFGILYLEEENLRSALSYFIQKKIAKAKSN